MSQLISSPALPPPIILRHHHHRRRRKISYGNPSLGTYDGFVVTSDVDDSETSEDNFRGCVVAMLHVPPEQVPEGVMNLARSHRNQIEHARIFISSSSEQDDDDDDDDDDTKVVDNTTTFIRPPNNSFSQFHPLKQDSSRGGDILVPSPSAQASQTAAAILATEKKSIRWEDTNHVYSQSKSQQHSMDSTSRPRTYMVLVMLSSPASAKSFVQDLHQKPYTTLDETEVAYIQYVIGLEVEEGNKSLGMKHLLSPVLIQEYETRTDDESIGLHG